MKKIIIIEKCAECKYVGFWSESTGECLHNEGPKGEELDINKISDKCPLKTLTKGENDG
jgi:hypothetical protein